ncbi:MAG: tripartite tricarboxylate transporter substrate binding protein [Limnohabitans sp.]|nr:tripartite tricarboxylate transporter substrate binding protein [Limnohabitans sp.]
MRREFLKTIAGCVPLLLVHASWSQTKKFPDRPLRFVVPFAAGGGGDTMARFLGQRFSERTGQSVFVENKVGASGNIGSDFVLKSPPDGYTLLNMSSTYAIQAAVSKLPFDPLQDMQAIAMVSRDPVVLVVGNKSPFKNLATLRDAAKREPNRFSYGSAGIGSIAHLGMEELAFLMGVKLIHIPYKGSSQAFNDVLSGNTDMMLTSATFGAPFIKSGRVIGLGVAGKERVANLPGLPTFQEQDIADYNVVDWKAIAGPKGISPDVVAYLNQEINAILSEKNTAAKFEADGTKLVGGTPEYLMDIIRSDITRWRRVVEKAQIKVE